MCALEQKLFFDLVELFKLCVWFGALCCFIYDIFYSIYFIQRMPSILVEKCDNGVGYWFCNVF